MKVVPQSAELLWITPNAVEQIEAAARTCYKSENRAVPGGASDFVKKIALNRGHESVIEHGVASFRIICDRGVSHEIVRHRIASFSQESTRYCAYDKDKFGNEISVIKPPGIAPCSPEQFEIGCLCAACLAYSAWKTSVDVAEECYLDMLASGATAQIARSVLPTCLKTELVMTANLREWRHFLALRTSSAAHPQIREVADAIGKILAREVPALFEEYGPSP